MNSPIRRRLSEDSSGVSSHPERPRDPLLRSTSTRFFSPSVTMERNPPAGLAAAPLKRQLSQDVISDDVLGQLSFAPATQTTVVTTTTTTTTKFPPIIMKAPPHLHDLDPKMYPLASSPTPQSIKRFCFDVGGRPALFSEADNTMNALEEVCPYCRWGKGLCFWLIVTLHECRSNNNRKPCRSLMV